MNMMVSIKTQLESLAEYRECHDLPQWPFDFIGDMAGKLEVAKGDTKAFSSKQVEKIEDLYIRYIVGSPRRRD